MRKDLERRLRRLELASSRAIEVWFEQPDGTLRSRDDEVMTRRAFYRLHPLGSPGVFVIKAGDAEL